MRNNKYLPCWLVTLLLSLNIGVVSAQSLSGTWYGTISLPFGAELSLVIHLTEEKESWGGTMDSPDQNAFDIPLSEVKMENTSLYFSQKELSISYKGVLNNKGAFEGTFEQNGFSLPLLLSRENYRYRPQTPQAPFPYHEEECTFFSEKQESITLSGTLTFPKNTSTPLPVVLLLTGSGPQDRDETLMGHKPFALIADTLTRAGFAVLRYDDRGVGKSTGYFAKASIQDLKNDALCAIRFLQQHPKIDTKRIYLLGHSEGGIIASMIAAQHQQDIAGIVLLAAPIQPLVELLPMQAKAIGALEGLDNATLDENNRINKDLLSIAVDSMQSEQELKKALSNYIHSYASQHPLLSPLQQKQLEEQALALLQPGIRSLLSIRPLEYLSQITCPIIALQGEKDVQVLPLNIDLLKEHCPKARTQLFAGLNHLFQPASTGSPREYARIEITIAPEALGWLVEQLKEIE